MNKNFNLLSVLEFSVSHTWYLIAMLSLNKRSLIHYFVTSLLTEEELQFIVGGNDADGNDFSGSDF